MVAPEPKPIDPRYYWGAILASAREGETTAQLWNRIRAMYPESGPRNAATVFQDVNTMRAAAAQITRASRTLGAAPGSDAITAGLIGHPIYERPPAAREALPGYEVIVEVNVLGRQGPETGQVRLQYGANLPDTVGQLRDEASMVATMLTESYGQSVASVGDIWLNAL